MTIIRRGALSKLYGTCIIVILTDILFFVSFIESTRHESAVSENTKIKTHKRSRISKASKHGNLKRQKNLHKRKRSGISKIHDAVPKYVINIRNSETSNLIRRSIHDLYVCQCIDGYLGAHCQRMS